MVELNPELEESKGDIKKTNQKVAPPKSVAEICELLESCVLDAASHGIDFLNFLCDAALNLDGDQLQCEKSAMELFFSDDFCEIGNLVNSWKEMRAVNQQRLADFMLQYRQEAREKAAQTLIFMWPYLYVVVEDLKKQQQQQQPLAAAEAMSQA